MTKITQELVREFLEYDPETGVLKWRTRDRKHFKANRHWSIWNARYAGKPAGTVNSIGYIDIRLLDQHYRTHRVIWLYMTGAWPSDQIDHQNHNRSDNRWKNLRQVTNAENRRNQSLSRNNTSGVAGVYWHAPAGKWMAQVTLQGRQRYLGLFVDKSDAVDARKAAEAALGFHPNHGRIAA